MFQSLFIGVAPKGTTGNRYMIYFRGDNVQTLRKRCPLVVREERLQHTTSL